MKRVIVTGATGFIGRQAIRPLVERGFEVHAVAPVPPSGGLLAEKVSWHIADLFDEAAVAGLVRSVGASHLLHFAWYVEPGRFWEAHENIAWKEASRELVRHFLEAGGRRVVASGTCAEYRLGDDPVLSEAASPIEPSTLYARCKAELSREIADLGANYAWGRIFFVFGPHESPKRFVAYVITSLLRGGFADCTHGEQIRDFLATREVGRAFAALVDSEVTGPVNVASGEPVSLRDLALEIAGLIGARERVRLGVVASPPDEPKRIVGDVARLRDEVKWSPDADRVRNLKETIAWWKRN